MAGSRRDDRYSAVAIAFHWTIALFVIANLTTGLLHDSIPALRAWMPGHKALGITVLVLTAARIAWRIGHRAPAPMPGTPRWQHVLAHASHGLLYLLLLAMPLSGWVMASPPEGRRPLSWFGLFDIPYLPATEAAADGAHSAHGVLGWLMLALVALHVAAALWHHMVLRDRVLARMAPVFARR
jgi:cytochrome b561